jgi:hypothetical protein
MSKEIGMNRIEQYYKDDFVSPTVRHHREVGRTFDDAYQTGYWAGWTEGAEALERRPLVIAIMLGLSFLAGILACHFLA